MNGRILVLAGDTFHAPGGIAQYNRDLISAWSRLDDIEEIVIVPRFASGPDAALPRKVVQKRPAPGLLSFVLLALVTSIRGPRFDFVFCAHMNMTPLASLIACLIGRPLWLQVHGIEAWNKRNSTVARSVETATLVTCVSRYTRRKLLSWSNLSPPTVHVLPNTFCEQFSPIGEMSPLLEEFKLSGKTILLTVSRLSRFDDYKGHDRVLHCLPQLLSEFRDLIYVIAGEGDLRHPLEELAKSLKVQESVRFLGQVAREALPSLYRAADVFVMPSRGEGFGIVYLESLACGTPVIAGNRDGSADPLHDGALGVLTGDDDLLDSIFRTLRSLKGVDRDRSHSLRIAATVQRAFGRSVFDSGVGALTTRLRNISHT